MILKRISLNSQNERNILRQDLNLIKTMQNEQKLMETNDERLQCINVMLEEGHWQQIWK